MSSSSRQKHRIDVVNGFSAKTYHENYQTFLKLFELSNRVIYIYPLFVIFKPIISSRHFSPSILHSAVFPHNNRELSRLTFVGVSDFFVPTQKKEDENRFFDFCNGERPFGLDGNAEAEKGTEEKRKGFDEQVGRSKVTQNKVRSPLGFSIPKKCGKKRGRLKIVKNIRTLPWSLDMKKR